MLERLMHAWSVFLDSLGSRGGGIYLSVVIFFSSAAMFLWTRLDLFSHITDIAAGTILGLVGGERLSNGKNRITSNDSPDHP